MDERNQYLEMDGLFWESETHEWFNDNISTRSCHRSNPLTGKGALPYLSAFVVRNKSPGEYDRVLLNTVENKVVYNSKSLEELSFYIDREKIIANFN